MSEVGYSQIASTFNANAQGWTTPNDADGIIGYSSTGGNPGGMVFGSPYVLVLGMTTLYIPYNFVAPGTYSGNRSAYYNGTLRYDVQQGAAGAPVQYAEVTITNSGGVSLYYFPTTPNQPPAAPTWATYSVVLNNMLGFWKTTNNATGTLATEAQVQSILTDLATLEIRGLYRDANITGRLDNVFLTPPIVITTQPASISVCNGLTATFTTTATGNPGITYQWQFESSPGIWTDLANGGGYNNVTTATLSVNTTGNFGTGNYRCRVSGTNVVDAFSNAATLTINALPAAPGTTGASLCGTGTVTLTATGGIAGQYRWYTVPVGGTAIAGQTDATYTTPSLTVTTPYYVAIDNGICEGQRTLANATINTPPLAPAATGGSSCGDSSITLTASGGTNGQYRWYTVPVGGTPIAGEANATYTTPILSTTTTYYVALNNGCESTRVSLTATINVAPAKPLIVSSTTPTAGNVSVCSSSVLTLTAPAGFSSYAWSNGATTAQITVTASGSYTVTVTNASGCASPVSDAIIVTVIPAPCNNQAPVITPAPISAPVEGNVSVSLVPLISDADNNLDLSTLKILSAPASGAPAAIDVNYNLVINYSGIAFSGTDVLTIEVCDLLGDCTQQQIEIDVIGDIVIYDGISPNDDNLNDIFFIQYIDVLADTKDNHVTIYTRWGDAVFETDNYDNVNRVFKGVNKNGDPLSSGTYFYKIEFTSGRATVTGYLSLKR